MSAPGVRIVTAKALPPTRISSGSSPESVSKRSLRAWPASRTMRRREVVRPMGTRVADSARQRFLEAALTLRDGRSLGKVVLGWPVLRQLRDGDRLGRGTAAESAYSAELTPRTKTADRGVQSICPYCAVGCGQRVYVKDEKVVQIEGDPDSPISRGRLCP